MSPVLGRGRNLGDEEADFLSSLARHAGITQGSSIWGATVSNPPQSFFGGERTVTPGSFLGDSIREIEEKIEDRNRAAAEAATRRPSRAASVETALGEIGAHAAASADASSVTGTAPAFRLAAIRSLVQLVRDLLCGDSDEVGTPEDARDALEWRRACDECYTDGIVARKCGLGPSDHGLAMDTPRSQSLAQAFALGWGVADEMAAFEDLAEAARLVLRFGDADSRDALRAALDKLPPKS